MKRRVPKKMNYIISEGEISKVIFIHKGREIVCLFDTNEMCKIKCFSWGIRYDTHVDNYYVVAPLISRKKGKSSTIAIHRMLMGEPDGMVVDHINGNTLDNRKENLRILSSGQNSQNRKGSRKGSYSGIRGVSYRSETNKWRVRLMVNNKSITIGNYETLEEAEQASIQAREKYMPYSKEALA